MGQVGGPGCDNYSFSRGYIVWFSKTPLEFFSFKNCLDIPFWVLIIIEP